MAAFEAGLAAITAAASAATSGAISASNTALANKRQYKNWLKQHDVQLADWQLQNAYNDPSRARERLENAGFNPNLAAGDSGNAQGISSPGQIPFERPDFSGLQEMYNNAARLYFEGESNRRANALVEQQINESKAREANYNELADLNAAKTAWEVLRESGYRENDLFGKKGRQMEAQIAYSLSQKAISDLNYDFLKKTFSSRVLYESLKNSLVSSKIALNKSNVDLNIHKAKELDARSYLHGRHSEHWDITNAIDSLLAPTRYQEGLMRPELMKNKIRQSWWNGDYYRARSNYTDYQGDYYSYLIGLRTVDVLNRLNPSRYIYNYFNPKTNGWIR